MSNDTIPTPVANGTPAEARNKPVTDGETLVAVTAGHFRIDIKKRMFFAIVSALSVLSGGAFWKSFSTDDDVSAVQDKVQVVEGRAEVAKATALEAATVVEEAYQDTRQKLDPTGQQIAELRADVDNLRAELEKERAARAGRRPTHRSHTRSRTMILETLLASGLGAMLVERAIDYILRRNKTTREIIETAARHVFSQLAKVGIDDKAEAHMAYRRALDVGLRGIKVKLSPGVSALLDRLFEQMWELRGRTVMDSAALALAQAGDRMERLGRLLATGLPLR